MGTFRLYSGADGQSHIETIDLAKTSDWTAGVATTNITFRSQPPGRFPEHIHRARLVDQRMDLRAFFGQQRDGDGTIFQDHGAMAGR